MTSGIEPKLFCKIMLLPQDVRSDVLEFVDSVSVGPEQLHDILDDLAARYIKPAKKKVA